MLSETFGMFINFSIRKIYVHISTFNNGNIATLAKNLFKKKIILGDVNDVRATKDCR